MMLKLYDNINPQSVREKVEKTLYPRHLEIRPNTYISLEQFIINTYIHRHSNYNEVMWSFWSESKGYCLREMSNLLIEISKLDKDLSWDCFETLKKYEVFYEKHHMRSQYVITEKNPIPNEFKKINKCMTKETAQHLVRHSINKSAKE